MIIPVHCIYCFTFGDGCVIFKQLYKLLENLLSMGGV